MLNCVRRVTWRSPGIALLLFLLLPLGGWGQADVDRLPKPTGYVEDYAHVLSAEDHDALEALCTRADQQLQAQIAIVTIDTLGGKPIRDFALELGRKWGLGAKGTNQGILIVLAIRDRENDIEVGRGLEPYVTDGFAGDVRRAMTPDLQQGAYGRALLGAARTLASHIGEGKNIPFAVEQAPERPEPREPHRRGGIPGFVIFLGIFFLFWLLGRGGRRGGRGGGGGAGDFLTGMLIGDLLGGRGRRNDDWGGGGFGGGSGGGGFGGFGGGDFGGGGASGKW